MKILSCDLEFCNVGARKKLNIISLPPTPHLLHTHKGTVAGEVTCPRSQSWLKAELRLEPRLTCGPVSSSILLWSCILVLHSCFYSYHWESGSSEDSKKYPSSSGNTGGKRLSVHHRLEEQVNQASMTGGGLGPVGGWERMNQGVILYIPTAF